MAEYHMAGNVLAQILTRLGIIGGSVGGVGYYANKKIDEFEEFTGSKFQGIRDATGYTVSAVEKARLQSSSFFDGLRERYPNPNTLDDITTKKQNNVEKDKNKSITDIVQNVQAQSNNISHQSNNSSNNGTSGGTGGTGLPPIGDDDDDKNKKPLGQVLKEMEKIQKDLQEKTESVVAYQTELAILQGELTKQKEIISKHENKYFEATNNIEKLEKLAYETEMKYQKEKNKLEQDLIDLRRQVLFERENRRNKARNLKSGIKRRLVDIYSEVLDTLSTSGYSSSDQLPRIVVVGDQSAGKTSVLESIAKARLFPRGAGQMMTKSPIKVTLCEGPRSEAYFPDAQERIYNLTLPNEEQALRDEIERRMNLSCKRRGATVSEIPVSLNVSGPGVRRMVLVDLPGVIATVTNEMHENTKKDIENMVRKQISNPNAIILCIQDGSVDAERSIVTELVSSIDPKGLRTVFALTKIDKAESQGSSSNRVKKILDGKLFPMKALGYHAVVTGRGEKHANDSIEQIKEYEEKFFQNSELFRKGLLKPSQLTSGNLSVTVSDLFWKMVRETVEHQGDAFKATKFNLETEWKNSFPRIRELDRYELFEKSKNEILDQVMELPSSIEPRQWEEEMLTRLWEQVSHHVVEYIFLPSAISSDSQADFNTKVDIKLKQWADNMLPRLAADVAKRMLLERFSKVLVPYKKVLTEIEASSPKNLKNPKDQLFDEPQRIHDPIFDSLREEVLTEAVTRHKWDEDYYQTLRVIQLNALEDRIVQDSKEWGSAIKFIEKNLGKRLAHTSQKIDEMIGVSTISSWYYWRYNTEEQKTNRAISSVLQTLLKNREIDLKGDGTPINQLSEEEVLTIRKNLEMTRKDVRLPSSNIETHKIIRAMWYQMYRKHFLESKIKHCQGLRKQFFTYKNECVYAAENSTLGYNQKMMAGQNKNISDRKKSAHYGFSEIVLFWRIQKMLEQTSNAVRQQMVNHEAKRLEKHVEQVLSDIGGNNERLENLLTGRRVTLAEDLKKVREIQNLLDEFITELRKEV